MRAPSRFTLVVLAVLAAASIALVIFGGKEEHHAAKHGQVAGPVYGDLQTPEPLRSEAPRNGVTQGQIDAGRREAQRQARTLRPLPPGQLLPQTGLSCINRIDSRLYSSRQGQRPIMFVVHYTAGNGTIFSIHSYFLSHPGLASATYIQELGGRCLQEVPESQKPWTQLTANRYSISVEIVTTGYNLSRAQWLASGIFRNGQLAALMRPSMQRWGIPLRRVDPVGCNWIAGWTDHNALECGNNHTDVQPNFPYDVLQSQLVHGAAPPKPVLSKNESLIVKRRCFHRTHATKWGPFWKRRAGAEKQRLDRAHAHGRSWGYHSIGKRRAVMARTERFNRADRLAVCH